MPTPSIVLSLDASASMTIGNQFKMAQTACGSFLSVMHTGDSLGVSAFSDNAWIAYPASSTLVKLIGSNSDLVTANSAVTALQTQNMTNMNAGIATGAAML